MKRYCFFLHLFAVVVLHAQTDIGGIVNDYAQILSIRSSKNELTLSDATAFHVGENVIVIQMQGALIDTIPGPGYGKLTAYQHAGRFERNVISRVTGNVITLRNRFSQAYSVGSGLQIVRMPSYVSARVRSTLTCPPWNGQTGGVLAIEVADTLYLEANADVSGCGFRGGQPGSYAQWFPSNGTDPKAWATNDSCCFSERGEGIAESPYLRGAAPAANGGGGGASEVHGGGGGAHVGCGGDGADVVMWWGNHDFGRAALPLSYATGFNRIFMGGGGGAGPRRSMPNEGTASGGRGGGIMIIDVPVIIGSNGSGLRANGEDGSGSLAAGGGGGAGGAIMTTATDIINVPQLQCTGGRGGTPVTSAARLCKGPGGGGGGGVVLLGTLNPLNLNPSAYTGGDGGQQLDDTCKAVQGKPACGGTVLYNTRINEDTVAFRQPLLVVRSDTSVCAGSSVHLSGKSTVPVSWRRGDARLCDACDSTTTVVDSTTTFTAIATYSDGTSDSASVLVTVYATPPISLIAPPPICPGDSALITAPAGYVSYAWSSGDTTVAIVVRAPGTYRVNVIDSNGCYTSASTELLYQALNVLTVDSIASGATDFIDVPSVYVFERSFVDVDVRSIEDTDVVIHRATMQRGLEISVPISLFPIVIQPRSTASVRVYAMSERPGDFADTMHLQSGCGAYDVPLRTRTWETPAYTRCRVRVTSAGEQERLLPPQVVMDAYTVEIDGVPFGTFEWTLFTLHGAVVSHGSVQASSVTRIAMDQMQHGAFVVSLRWEGGRAAGLVLKP